MSKFIDNINTYLSEMKIKQTYVSLKTGIDKNKLSRILTGAQDVNSTDMERLADALGQKMEYFLKEDFQVVLPEAYKVTTVTYCSGRPGKRQEQYAKQLVELLENVDEVLGARGRYMMNIGE